VPASGWRGQRAREPLAEDGASGSGAVGLAGQGQCSGGALPARHAHRGHKKAVIAVAHAILISAYYMLARQVPYQELGPEYFDRHHADRVRRRAIQALERQGYRVILEAA